MNQEEWSGWDYKEVIEPSPYPAPAAVGAEPDKDIVRLEILTLVNRIKISLDENAWDDFYNGVIINHRKNVSVHTKKDPKDPESKAQHLFLKPEKIVYVEVLDSTFWIG